MTTISGEEVNRLRVAIGEELKECARVITLGVRSQISDYTEEERGLLRTADMIFYPTARFADLFATLGKDTFPSVNCYRLCGDRLKQTALLRLLGVPQPRTRVYYGAKQKQDILKDFVFPLVAKKSLIASDSKHVFLISDKKKLDWYNRHYNPAYIQEYVAAEQEVRVIVLNNLRVFGYWRKAARGSKESYARQGGEWQMDEVPAGAAAMSRDIARDAGLSDVAVDMIFDGSRYWVLELDFQYSEKGWPQSGKTRIRMVMEMIEQGEL